MAKKKPATPQAIKTLLQTQSKTYRGRVQPVENAAKLPLFVLPVKASTILDWQALCQQGDRSTATGILVAEALCDESGERVYESTDLDEVLELPPGILTDISHAALVMAGVIDEGATDEHDIEGKSETNGSGTS